ncbi:lysine--tRNA ligase [Pelagibacterales bacterium]|nr:lysine--tRNA ligase [Pelagibacterales bacterium]
MKNFKELALESKAWPVVEARKILDRVTKSGNKSINLQTGYGPSGLPHIGTFGEVARTTMIYNALKNLTDLEINLLTFSDDLDGLRKVPDNIPNTKPLEENLNRPLTSIPDPFGTHPSFGEHNNAMLRDFLDKFEFNYEFKSATNLYKSGFFDEQLINVLRNHDKIKNIVLPTLGVDRQKTYSPFLPICPDTNKVLEVEILETKLDNNSITYKHNNKLYEVPVTGGHCKLQWKVDWAMRWIALGIDYEMYGKDLIPTFQLSAKICRALGGNPPENYFYELFLDQNGEKISKSKGNGLTIDQWLSYAPPETLSYFMYQNPRRAKKLFLDVIPKSTDEFISLLNKFDKQSDKEKLDSPIWHIFNGNPLMHSVPVSYNILLNLVSASTENDSSIILDFVERYVGKIENKNLEFLKSLIDCVTNFNNDVSKNISNFKTPNTNEIKIFNDLISRLQKMKDETDAEIIQTEIYQIGKDYEFENLRDWFKLVYQVLFGKDDGPRFGTFVAIYGIEKTIKLIESRLI